MDMAPTRSELEIFLKGDKETFKEYARRWRGTAAKVRPPLTEKEMTGLFIGTLKQPFLDRLLACASMNLSDMIATGDRIEDFLRRGIIQSPELSEHARKSAPKTKEADVSNIVNIPKPQPYFQQPYFRHPSSQYIANTYVPSPQFSTQPVYQHQQQNYQYPQPLAQQTTNPPPQQYNQRPSTRPRANFPPLPASPSLIYRQLLSAGRIQPVPPPPPLQLPILSRPKRIL